MPTRSVPENEARCPHCGRFTGIDPDGFYDRLEPNDCTSYHGVFCNEACAEARRRTFGTWPVCNDCGGGGVDHHLVCPEALVPA